MPRVPKSAGTKERATRGTTRKPRAAKDGEGKRRDGSKPARNGGRGRTAKTTTRRKPAKVDFARRPVDEAAGSAAGTKTVELNEFERGLLGDLFAVIEEHDSPARGHIDRDQVERAFVFACERHADQRRKSGGLHRASGRRGEDLRGDAARHR